MDIEDSETIGENFFFPNPNLVVSRNLYLFLSDYHSVVDLFFFTISLAHRADDVALTASKVLIDGAKNEDERRRYQENIDNPSRAVRKLNDFGALNSRNLTVNIIDSFLWFVSAIIQSSMKKRPELVKSGESIKIEDVFDFRSKKEMINYLIDRRVNSLSYGGMDKIEKFISDSLGVNLFNEDESRNIMKIFIETRNIHVHNRGFVNRIFLSRVEHHRDFEFVEGKRAHLNFDHLVNLSRVCIETSVRLDEQISKKFGIERKRYGTWKKKKANSVSSPSEPS